MQLFTGTFTMLVTPFTSDGAEIEEAVLKDFVDWQIDQGIAGVIPLGSTGEFLSLTDAERRRVADIVVRQANGRIPVLIGTGAENTCDAIRFSREAQDLGADGVLVIPPFYSTPTEEEITRHYESIAAAISIPVMIYNNPATANVNLSPTLVASLSRIPNVSYIKDSSLDPTRVRDIIRLSERRMTVFGGILGFEAFMNGALGWTAVAANLMPRECSDMFRLCVHKADVHAARELYHRICPVIELVGEHRYVGATKKALELMGLPVGPPRPPRLPFEGANLAWAQKVVRDLELKFR
jgi:4-hydroxy-tetrahydrodipicolinate synthase